MEGGNFVLPGTKRVPSLFAAGCMFFLAVAGKLLLKLFGAGLLSILSSAGKTVNEELFSTVLGISYYLFFVVLPFRFYALGHPGTGEYARFKPMKPVAAVIAVVAGAVAFYLCGWANALWLMLLRSLGMHPSATQIIRMNGAAQIISRVLYIAVMPGLCEEFLFRGAILSAWEEKGSRRAIYITALLFAMIHSSSEGFPSEFIAGVLLGYIVVISGSVFTGALFHTVFNALSLVYMASAKSVDTAGQSLPSAAGGAGGLVSQITSILLLVLIAAAGLAEVGLLKLLHKRLGGGAIGCAAVKGEEKGPNEWIVLSCGILLAIALYVPGILRLAGVPVPNILMIEGMLR